MCYQNGISPLWLLTGEGPSGKDITIHSISQEMGEHAVSAPGDIILINRRDTRVSWDGIYVLRIDEAVMVKRLHRLPGEIIEATGDNPTGRAFEIRLDTEDQDLAVIGRVVWAGKRL